MVCVSESFILWLGEGGEIWQLEASCSLPSVHYRPQHEGGEQEGGEDGAQRASRQAFFLFFVFTPRHFKAHVLFALGRRHTCCCVSLSGTLNKCLVST